MPASKSRPCWRRASASPPADPGDWIARHVLGVPVLTRAQARRHPRPRQGRSRRDRARGPARDHRLRRRRLHRPLPAGDGDPQGQPYRPRPRHRRSRRRSVFPLLRSSGLRRRQSAAAGRDLGPVLGRGPHRCREYDPILAGQTARSDSRRACHLHGPAQIASIPSDSLRRWESQARRPALRARVSRAAPRSPAPRSSTAASCGPTASACCRNDASRSPTDRLPPAGSAQSIHVELIED